MEPDDPAPRDTSFVRSVSREQRERAEALRLHAAEVVARARETTARVNEAVEQVQCTFGLRSVRTRERDASGAGGPAGRSL